MTNKSNLPRLPKILEEKVAYALFCVNDLAPEIVSEYLKNYRWNLIQLTVANGITCLPISSDASSDKKKNAAKLKFVPHERYEDIRRLDDAYKERDTFLDNGADDYIAIGVEGSINSFRGSGTRKSADGKTKDERYDEICKYMKSYKNSDNKAALVSRAANHFSVSERTINTALSWGEKIRKKK